MKIFDISMPIYYDMQVYKNRDDRRPKLEVTRHLNEGAFETRLSLDMHTGTHMDAPLHMVDGGADISSFSMDNAISQCRVLDLSDVEDGITKLDLENKNINPGEVILLKTKNSMEDNFNPNFIYLKKEGAKYLADKRILGVGIDSLGIERNQPGHETHLVLLNNGIFIIEGFRLSDIKEGCYYLIAAPLNIPGAEASPVRAFLLEKGVQD